MKPRPYVLAETNWKAVKETEYKVAVLPWGATEAHNYHLPYATDVYEATYIAEESARLAWEQGAKVVVLPTIPFGINTGQLDIKLCMNLNPSTQFAILKDVADVLTRHNIHKFVILNSHGGNNFKTMIRELSFHFPEVFTCSVDWFRIQEGKDVFEEKDDHAGEMETSVILHLHPHLVMPLKTAGPGKGKQYKLKGFQEGWASSQRKWTQVTEDTGVGNPYKATAEKGAAYLASTTRKVADFLAELERTPLEEMYE